MKRLGVLSVLFMSAMAASAELRVVATVPNLGMLARAVGGEAVKVRVLAPADRDPHYLEARPSMMAALRRADIVVATGAELEIGWLPAAIRGANNRRIQEGQPGYFEATRFVALIGTGKPADRALGDVHPAGNPHVYLDPERMAVVAEALAARFSALKPEHAEAFHRNAAAFADEAAGRMPAWRVAAEGAPGVLAYHSDADYLLAALDVPLLGHIEPLPGIPPTAAHLSALVRSLRGREGVIWSITYNPAAAGAFLARELDWNAVQLPAQVGPEDDAEAYFALINAWVATLKGAE